MSNSNSSFHLIPKALTRNNTNLFSLTIFWSLSCFNLAIFSFSFFSRFNSFNWFSSSTRRWRRFSEILFDECRNKRFTQLVETAQSLAVPFAGDQTVPRQQTEWSTNSRMVFVVPLGRIECKQQSVLFFLQFRHFLIKLGQFFLVLFFERTHVFLTGAHAPGQLFLHTSYCCRSLIKWAISCCQLL